MTCFDVRGQGKGLTQFATVSGLVGTRISPFTYDAPCLTNTKMDGSNSATTGGADATVQGLNFGAYDATATHFFAGKDCSTTAWTTGTTIVCTNPLGTGQPQQSSAVASILGTSSTVFSFDSPTVTLVFNNGVMTGGSYATITGLNFGSYEVTPSAQLGMTACGTTSWSTTTSLWCVTLQGIGIQLDSPVIVSQQVGTYQNAFSFDAAVVTLSYPPNLALTGKAMISVYGLNFGSLDYSPTTSIGSTQCDTANWMSVSSLKCLVKAGSNQNQPFVPVTIAAAVGTGNRVFTYDAPVISMLAAMRQNSPMSGGASVTTWGLGFFSVNLTPTILIGSGAANNPDGVCSTSSWSALTSMRCQTREVLPLNSNYRQARRPFS